MFCVIFQGPDSFSPWTGYRMRSKMPWFNSQYSPESSLSLKTQHIRVPDIPVVQKVKDHNLFLGDRVGDLSSHEFLKHVYHWINNFLVTILQNFSPQSQSSTLVIL